MKKVLKVLLIIIAIIILLVGTLVIYITSGLKKGANLQINDVNILNIKDGTYKGKYASGRWSNNVEVIVKDHKITDIEYTKDITFPNEEGKKKLIEQVYEKQSLTVDVVSGATVTTKAYLKSIENALTQK